MRTYRRNSPQAAARIVALVMIADGHVDANEERMLARLGVIARLGLQPGEFDGVVQALCEDLAISGGSDGNVGAGFGAAAHAALLAEVDDPALRRVVLRACLAVASADDYLADGEIAALAAIFGAWAVPSHAMSGALAVAA
ncbi:MAG: TerB family tellurite resistance protein [Burkholderia gladioli]